MDGNIRPLDLVGVEQKRGFVHSKATPEAIKRSWQTTFTNPRRHNDRNFRYLIHGFQGKAGDIIQILAVLDAMKRGEGDMSQNIDLLEQPHRIGDKKIISASVIDHKHQATFGEGGLILNAPFENILDATSKDQGTYFFDPERAISESKRNLPTVDELLEASSNDEWNEVRLLGKTDAGEVGITGLWIKINERGIPLDPEMAKRLKDLAFRQNLPIVEIVEKVKKYTLLDNGPEIHEDITTSNDGKAISVPRAFSINRGGLRYNLDFARGTFSVVNDERKFRPMTDAEFAFAKHILETELDPAKKEELRDVIDGLDRQFKESKK